MSNRPSDRSFRRFRRRFLLALEARNHQALPPDPSPKWPRTWAEREAQETGVQRKGDHAAHQLEQQAAPALRTTWHHGARVTRPA